MSAPQLSQGATLSFNGANFSVVSISASGPRPELVMLNGINGSIGEMNMHWTGDYEDAASVDAEVLAFANPSDMVGSKGALSVSAPGGGSVSGQAICTGAVAEARVGDLLRSRLTFSITTAQ